jgi:predicted RNA-binding Zn ribbon-like protein
MVTMDTSAAPGRLEQVRTFLNTWWIPNDTRLPRDDLADLASDSEGWSRSLPDVPPPRQSDHAQLLALRAQLRATLGTSHPTGLADQLAAHEWRLDLTASGAEPPLRIVPALVTSGSALLAIAVEAVAGDRWHRLRACPDCGWVFYDSSRNARRTWCSMTAAGGARGCGSIAKTRAYRARRAKEESP